MDMEPTQHHRMNSQEKYCLAAILLLATVLRLIRLGTFPFWADEVYSLVLSQDLAGIFFHGRFMSSHPPLAYFLLALWRIAGLWVNEWTIRALPALFGVFGSFSIFWLARQFFNTRTALIAAFLIAVSPFHITHSQDLKEYIYLPVIASFMVGFFYRGFMHNRKRDWLMYGFLAGIGCYTEFFVAPLLVAINCWFLLFLPSHKACLKGWFLSNMLGAFLFLPWLSLTLHKVMTYMIKAEGWWVPWPSPLSILYYFKTVAFGYAAVKPLFHIAFIVFAALTVYGICCAWRNNRQVALLLILWAFMPVTMVYAISFVGQSIFLIRSLIPFSIAIYILVALALNAIKLPMWRFCVFALVIALCGTGVGAHYLRILHPNEFPHRPGVHPPMESDLASRYVREHIQDGDIVVHGSIATWLPFYWYAFSDHPQYTGAYSREYRDFVHSSTPVNTDDPVFLNLWPKMIEELVPGHQRIWFVYAEWEREYLGWNPINLYRWLDSRFMEIEHIGFKDIEVMLFAAPESDDYAPVLERSHDTGVSAKVRYAEQDQLYVKTLPDFGLKSRAVEERQGSMELSFGNSVPGQVCFVLKNNTDSPRDCEIQLLASEVLIPCASLDRESPQDMTWQVGSMYNHAAPPPTYDLAVLTANLEKGAGTVQGSITIPAGNYVPWIFMIAPYNNYEYWTAPLDIRFNDAEFVVEPLFQLQRPGLWNWVQGIPLQITEQKPLTLSIEAQPLSEERPGYANLAYIAFVPTAWTGNPQYTTLWNTQASITANDSQTWDITTAPEVNRVDIWAYEKGTNGKIYHIFLKRHI